MAYTFSHTVEAHSGIEAAWAFWTNVDNWKFDAAIETVELDGRFEKGSKGTTGTVEGQLIEWEIVEIGDHTAVIEIPLSGAVGRFEWRFLAVLAGGTSITQRITLSGKNADSYLAIMNKTFEQGVREGMTKLAAAME